jgi:hypothetical protein
MWPCPQWNKHNRGLMKHFSREVLGACGGLVCNVGSGLQQTIYLGFNPIGRAGELRESPSH